MERIGVAAAARSQLSFRRTVSRAPHPGMLPDASVEETAAKNR